MEVILALLLAAVSLAAALSARTGTTRTGRHRDGLTVAAIEARLDAEHCHTFAPVGRW
ncbi:hypothetical protein [Nocardia sp. NPDC127526]|uniref:hypothetical protein n=1 Tax=Nocardia sp. NPDC127526 TaxID=3345393 RepID=UPI00363D122A